MAKAKYKTIGILGGMGPEASANLYWRMIKYTQDKYNAVQDTDYPPIIIYSLPLEGFDETGIVDKPLVKNQLIDGIKKLNLAGADFIIVSCNTVHYFHDDMQKASQVPVFNIIKETRKKIESLGYKKVGLFSSETTKKLGLYQNHFKQYGIEIVNVNKENQSKLNQIIEHVMGGYQNQTDADALNKIAEELADQGAESVVMGCTEIPLAINQSQTKIKLLDTIEIITKAAVDYSIIQTEK